MKKAISLILSLLMLVSMFVTVSAEDTYISDDVLNSITEEDETGLGLAFLYTMSLTDFQYHSNRTFVSAYAGEDKVVALGAIVSNQAETGEDANAMVIENTNGKKLLNVVATRLWGNQEDWTNTQIQYAVRITNIPTENEKDQIYSRPYYILEDGTVVYGDITNASYFEGWCEANPIKLPENGTDIDVKKKKGRICVSASSQYVEYEERIVTLKFQNYTTNWITEETDWVQYTCYDANGNAIDTQKIYIGCIDTKKNKTKTFYLTVPDETAELKLTGSQITYWTEWA